MSIDQSHAASTEAPQPGGANGSDSQAQTGPGWFSLLKSTLGINTSSLRETLEHALRAESTDKHAFTAEEREMLLRLLRYGGLRVDDIMVPRADITAVEENETIADVLRVFVESGVSRVPVYAETMDDPRGVVHVKDLIAAIVQDATTNPDNAAPAVDDVETMDLSRFDLTRSIGQLKVRRPALYVPPSMPAMNLLLRMQSTRIHMALVVDEYGGTDGLVTIEDLVEQIVGDIDDEHDEDEAANVTGDAKQGLVAVARTPVEELEELVGVKLLTPDDEDDVDTIGGLVFSLVGRVPGRGELIPHPSGMEFEILDADPRRIKKVKVHLGKLSKLGREPAVERDA